MNLVASVPSAFAEDPFVSFDQTVIGIDESAGTVTVAFTVNGDPYCYGYYAWKVFTEDGTATAGADYVSTSQQFSLTIDPYSNDTLPYSGSIEIPIIGNCIDGPDRSFSVAMEVVDVDAQCQFSTGNPATVTIADDDIPLSASPSALPNLSGAPGQTITGSIAVSGGTAPYQAAIENISPSDYGGNMTAQTNGSVVSYSFQIPSFATSGEQIVLDVAITDSCSQGGPNATSVPVAITVEEDLAVDPTQLDLSAIAGQQVSGTVAITGGAPPYSADVTAGEGQASISDDTATYSYDIPPNTPDGQFSAEMTVSDSLGNSVVVPVTITVEEGLKVDPAGLSLSGIPGEQVSGSVTISGGKPSYAAEIVSGVGQASVSGDTATFSYDIPADDPEGAVSAKMTVSDSLGNSVEVPVTVKVGEGLGVDPAELSLSGLPGEQVSGSVTISGGKPSYAAEIVSGVGQASVSDDTATFTYDIPADEPEGTVTAKMTVSDSLGSSVEVPVTVKIGEGLGVDPAELSLSGLPGEQVSGSVKISGGKPSYAAEIVSGVGQASVSDDTATFTYDIPADEPEGIVSAKMTVSDSLGNTVEVPVTVKVGEGLGVDPAELSLSGLPGEQVSGSVKIAGGKPSYTAEVVSGVGQASVSGDTATFSYDIPAGEPEGTLSAKMTVSDSLGNSVEVPVTVEIGEGLGVDPAELSLSGLSGEQVSGSVKISGGKPSYSAEIVSGLGQAAVSGDTATYSYDIPASEPEGTVSAKMTVSDSLGNSVHVLVTIKVEEAMGFNPDQLGLTGYAGQQAKGSATISGGTPPYSANVSEGSGDVAVSDVTVEYAYRVPADAEEGAEFLATVTATDAKGNSATLKVKIAVDLFDPLTGTLSLTQNQKSVAKTVETICPALNEMPGKTEGQKQLSDRCNAMVGSAESDPTGVENALAEITPDEAGTQATLTNKTAFQQLTNVGNRLAAVRAGATGFSASGLSFGIPGETELAGLVSDIAAASVVGNQAAGLDEAAWMKKLGVFVTGRIDFGDRDSTKKQTGFDFDTLGITAGADYRFTKDLVLGIAGGYADTGVDYDNDGGDLDIDAWSVSLFGNYYMMENFYVDAIVNFGWDDYDQKRKVAYSLENDIPISTKHKSDYSGDQYSISVGAGYEFDFDAWKLEVNGRMNYTEIDVDGYTEDDPDNTGLNLAMDDYDTDSFTTTLGLQASYVFNTDIGVFIPKLAGEWEHEYSDDSFNVTGHFVNDPNPASPAVFSIETDDPTRDYFRLSPGVSMVFPHGITSYVNFDMLLGYDDYESYSLSFGARFEF